VLDRLDLDTEKPSEEELAKRFGYEDDYYNGKGFDSCRIFQPYSRVRFFTEYLRTRNRSVGFWSDKAFCDMII
jgi:hypothetical protein